MPDMIYVDSSNVDQIGYDEPSQELHVTFKNGGYYVYLNVPEHIFDGLKNAASVGSYLNREIKGAYSFEKRG